MGRIITPKYRVEIKTADGDVTASSWRGQATIGRLDKYIADYNASLLPGGVNQHIGKRWPDGGKRACFARVLRQADDWCMCYNSYPKSSV